jgi:hypothetical protein
VHRIAEGEHERGGGVPGVVQPNVGQAGVPGMSTEGVSVALQPCRPAELVDDDEIGVLVGRAGHRALRCLPVPEGAQRRHEPGG